MTMYDYILEQASLLPEVLSNRKELAKPFCNFFARANPDHLYLVASGSSRNSATVAASFMEEVLQIAVTVIPPSQLGTPYGSAPAAMFLSQGGNSTNTITAIEQWSSVPSLAMTGSPDGRINVLCPDHVEMPCGEETAGPKTKGYTVAILTLYVMALEAALECGRISDTAYAEYLATLEQGMQNVQTNISITKLWLEENLDDLKALRQVYITGKRQGAFVAEEGALKIMETMLIPAAGYDFEEFLHGPTCSLNKDIAGFYLLPVNTDSCYHRILRLAEYHRGLGSSVYVIGLDDPSHKGNCPLVCNGGWYTQPFQQILPMQMVCAILPDKLELGGEGMRRFKALSEILQIKYNKP